MEKSCAIIIWDNVSIFARLFIFAFSNAAFLDWRYCFLASFSSSCAPSSSFCEFSMPVKPFAICASPEAIDTAASKLPLLASLYCWSICSICLLICLTAISTAVICVFRFARPVSICGSLFVTISDSCCRFSIVRSLTCSAMPSWEAHSTNASKFCGSASASSISPGIVTPARSAGCAIEIFNAASAALI